jgi:hypothetical protein
MRKAPAMHKTLSATAVLIAGMALLGTSSARAVTPPATATLLSLDNPPTTTGKPYDLLFTAEGKTTTISIGGYDDPGYEYVWNIGVTLLGGGPPLLSTLWPPPVGLDATQSPMGSLTFGDISPVDEGTFAQTFATTRGDTYLLSFDFANCIFASGCGPDSGQLLVMTSGESLGAFAVPELTTWTMALLGFAGLGVVGYRRGRKTESRTRAA